MLIKFNNIRDLSDARYAAAAMAEWIGFSIGSENSLPAVKIQEIIGWCAGPKIILELPPGLSEDVLTSYLDVLPADGIELDLADYLRLRDLPMLSQKQFIVRTDEIENSASTIHTHSSNVSENHNHILNIIPEKTDAGSMQQLPPYAMSIDCFDAPDPALKNYDVWNDFFEQIGVF